MLFAWTLKDVLDMVVNALNGLMAWLCEIIYPWIASVYGLFMDLSSLVYTEEFNAIYNKISLLIGIFMLFRVTFWLIELLVNPDQITDKEKNPGNIVKKVLLVVILLATTPRIFKIAFSVQEKVIDNHLIEKILYVGNSNGLFDGDGNIDSTSLGNSMSADLFKNFFKVNPDIDSDSLKGSEKDNYDLCNAMSELLENNLRNNGRLNYLSGNTCLDDKIDDPLSVTEKKAKINIVQFDGLLAVLVGGFVLYMMLMYCISIGTRYIQLIFLQIIAPVPIMCYLTPKKDNMFSKWVKQCTTTYLDLFIRIVIINFVVILINMLFSSGGIMDSISVAADKTWIQIFLTLGLLTFAKKAPDLIQELLPKGVTKASGDFGLSWKKRTDAMVGGKLVYGTSKLATAGVATGAVTGAVGFLGGRGAGRLTGLLGGTLRGLGAGAKKGSFFGNMKQSVNRQQDINKRKIDWANSGSTWSGRMEQRLANALGFEGTAESFENEMSKIDTENGERKRKTERLKTISSEVGNMENRAKSKLSEKGQLKGYGGELQQRRVNYGAINDAMKNGDIESARKVAQNEMERANRNISNLISSPGYNEDNYRRWKELRDKENLTNDEKIEFENLTTKEIRLRDKAEKEWEMANNTISKLYDGTMTSAESSILQNQVNKETEENYVSASLDGIINDDIINNSARNVSTARNEILEFASSVNLNLPADELDKDESFNEIKNLFEKVGDYYVLKPEFEATIDDYSVVDKLKGSSKSTENDIQYHIGENERRKADIQASEEYNKAKKDRDVVGGHSGKR